jgi:thiol-disulfide isomerase/thioredoxin
LLIRRENIVLILLLLLSSNFAWAGQLARLTFRVIDPKPEAQVSLTTMTDELSNVDKTETLLKRSEQEFYVNLDLSAPTTAKLNYDGRYFELYVEPGDDLYMSFEGSKFPASLLFTGKGTEHNTYLLKFRDAFNGSRDNVLTNYINNFTPTEYRKWMNEIWKKRWTFYHDYDGLEKEGFSKNFVAYACAEIDYWYGYHLMRYKQEHEEAGNVLSKFVQIPENYYDFLNGIIINNDDALVHPLYRKFLKLYLSFRTEFPASFIGLASKQMILTIKVPSMELLATPTNKVVGYAPQGTKVLVLEKLTFGGGGSSNNLGSLPTAYRIKVKTNDGQEGWIKTSGLEFDPEPSLTRQGVTIEGIEITSKKMIKKGRVGYPLLNVMNEPYENSVMETVKQGQELIYMNQKTDQLYNYKDQDSVAHQSVFYKVMTPNGKIGWVCACAISLFEKEVEEKVRKQRLAAKSKNAYNNIDFLLYNKSRIFALATDIEYRLHFEQPNAVKPQYELFQRENSTGYLRKEVEKVFQNAIANPIPLIATTDNKIEITGVYDITPNIPQGRFRVEADPSAVSSSMSARPNVQRTMPSQNTNTTYTNPETTSTATVAKPRAQIGTGVNINKKTEATSSAIATPQTISTITTIPAEKPKTAYTPPPTTTSTTDNYNYSPPKAASSTTSTEVPKEYINPKKIEVKMPNSQYELIGTTLRGKVTDPRGINVSLTLMMDVINLREASYTTKIKADNTFTLEFFLAEPAVGELICGSDTIPMYLEPNDQVELELNGKDKNFLACSGTGSAHIMFLDGFMHYSKQLDKQVKAKTRTLTAEAFRDFMSQSHDTKKQFLDNYQDRNSFSATFLSYAQADMDYWYAFYMSNYPWEYPIYFNEAAPAKVPPNYYDYLTKIKIQNDVALPSKNYRYFLDQHLSDLRKKSNNNNITLKEIAEKNLTGKTLAYCRAKQIAQDLSYDINSQKINAVKNFVVNSTYPLYNEAVVAALYRQLPMQSGASAPSFRLSDANGKEITLEELRGKVIYLDFWATWCAPCIQALPHTERIRQRFNENDVAFVYINLDEDKNKWLRYLAEHPLGGKQVNGNSPNPYRETVSALYQATKLPATVIIDRNGNIAADANEHLDSETAATKIQNLISK